MGDVDAFALVWCRRVRRGGGAHERLVLCTQRGAGSHGELFAGPRADHPCPGRRGESLVNLGRLNLVVLATVVIFAAGVVTGSLIVKKTSQPPITQPFWGRFEMMRRAVDELDRQSELNPRQRA